MPLQFWFEFGSTYSYPAAMRVEALAAQHGVRIAWRAFLLGPIFRDLGWADSPFNLQPAKGRYMWRDLERICADLQVPFQRPSTFPRNGLLAARIACHFAEAPWLSVFVRAVYRANFAEDRDISDRSVIAACLAEADQAPDAILPAAESQEAKDSLRANTQQAAALGIFGAPSFTTGGELFWGNDRLEAAIEWHATHGAQRS